VRPSLAKPAKEYMHRRAGLSRHISPHLSHAPLPDRLSPSHRLVLALCAAEGKRRYTLVGAARTVMECLDVYFARAAAEMASLRPLLAHLVTYEQQARRQVCEDTSETSKKSIN
jgi:hypothetical protein